MEGVLCKQKHFFQQGRVLKTTVALLWQNCYPVACFAAGHRQIYKTDLDTMDVHFRRLLRSVVGPPSQTNLLNPWHEISHDWNARVARYVQEAGVLTWSQRSLQRYWHLCSYIVGLPNARWVSRILVWRCRNTGKRGRPFRLWHSTAETICRWHHHLGHFCFPRDKVNPCIRPKTKCV